MRNSLGASASPTASPGLRPEPQERLGLRRVPHGAGVLPLARQLGDNLGGEPAGLPAIERAAQIENYPTRPRRRDLWPPEIWAEMEQIRNGEKA